MNKNIIITKYVNNLKVLDDDDLYMHYNENLLFDKIDINLYKDKNLLLIGLGSINRYIILKYIKTFKFNKFVCLTNSENINNEIYKNIFDDIIIAEDKILSEKDNTLNTLNNYMIDNNIKFDAIINFDEFSCLMCFYLAQSLNLNTTDFEIAQYIKNKYNFRKFLSINKFNCPNYFLIKFDNIDNYINKLNTLKDLNNKMEFDNITLTEKSEKIDEYFTFKLPLILKPIYGSGKLLIKKINTIDDFIIILNNIKEENHNIDFLIEEFIDTDEYDVDIILNKNKITYLNIIKNFKHDENFQESGESSPFDLNEDIDYPIIEKAMTKWFNKLNLCNGLFHFEIKYDKITKHITPIELNLRLGGSANWALDKLITNVDIFKEYINVSLNINSNENINLNKESIFLSRNIYLTDNNISNIVLNYNNIINNNNLIQLHQVRTKNEIKLNNKCIFWILIKIDNNLNILYNEDNLNLFIDNYINNIISIN